MLSHPDADAFMRAYLEQPVDATARLVFADWLEETGEAHNSAWAHFIRLKIEANRFAPDSPDRLALDHRANEYAPEIRARLTIGAKMFVGYPKSLLQLLPAPNITVRLARFAIPLSRLGLLPESIARENLVVPLDLQGTALLMAATHPRDAGLWRKLEFILNQEIVLVRAEPDDLQEALDRHYGQTELETVDSFLVEFVDTTTRVFTPLAAHSNLVHVDTPVVRLVNLILMDAVNRRADRISFHPAIDAFVVRFRIAGVWLDRDHVPIRLLRPILTRLAIVAGIDIGTLFDKSDAPVTVSGTFPFEMQSARFRVSVRMESSPDGLSGQLDIAEEPS